MPGTRVTPARRRSRRRDGAKQHHFGRRRYFALIRTPDSTFQTQVNRMTNWQRNQWARAGYPGLRPSHDTERLGRFMRELL